MERLTDLPLSLAVRAVGAALSRLGPRSAYRFARVLGRGWYRWFPRRRRVALRNLEIAFRDRLSPAEREGIARESCCHAMATALDVLIRERIGLADAWPRFIVPDRGVEEAITRPHPRGLAVLSAHLGDWEMVQYYFVLRGLTTLAITRRIHNPHIDRLVRDLRTRHGGSVIHKSGALRQVVKTLRTGGVAGLLADQSAPAEERFQKFFGASASTHFRYARLLARLKPEVLFIVCVREGFEFRFRLLSRDLTAAIDGPGSEEERAQKLVEEYLRALEEVIRAHPQQYLWMHRRWKLRPPGAPDLYLPPPGRLDGALEREDP